MTSTFTIEIPADSKHDKDIFKAPDGKEIPWARQDCFYHGIDVHAQRGKLSLPYDAQPYPAGFYVVDGNPFTMYQGKPVIKKTLNLIPQSSRK